MLGAISRKLVERFGTRLIAAVKVAPRPSTMARRGRETSCPVPASVGLPIMILGSETIRACAISVSVHSQFTAPMLRSRGVQ